jgi:DNA-binding response OmpR family regulator
MKTLLESPAVKNAVSMPMTPNLRVRILMVEDDMEFRLINAKALADGGYQVDTAEDGITGLEALHANSFHLLITDHDMPRLTGLELVKKVRDEHMNLPIILAAEYQPDGELERRPWLQLAAILFKPFSACQLLETVKEVLRSTSNVSFVMVGGNSPRNRSLNRHWGLNE